MSTFQKTILALAAGSLLTVSAQAAVSTTQSYGTAQPYAGLKVGQYDVDSAKDETLSYGAYVGAQLTPRVGVEAEYMGTETEDISDTHEYDAEVYGLFANYKMQSAATPVYAKGRVGVAENKVDTSRKSDGAKSKFTDTGFAGGLGLGYDFNPNAAVELAYEWYPSIYDGVNKKSYDANGITLGAHFKF